MNAVVQFAHHIPTLAEKAMLVNLKVGVWDGYAYDEVATKDGFGSSDLGRANKSLLKHSKKFKDAKSAFNAVRAFVNQNTLPWKDNGVRLLPSDVYMEFVSDLGTIKAAAERALDEFVQSYHNEIADDKVRFDTEAAKTGKASLFKATDYPSNIRDKFYIAVQFEPIPQSSDFRVQVSESDRRALDEAIARAQSDVNAHLIEEMAKPLRALAAHLAKPVEDVKRFHDSIVTNVDDAAQRLSKLNVNNDPNVNRMISEVRRELGGLIANPTVVKDDQSVREAARAKLNAMMSNMGIV